MTGATRTLAETLRAAAHHERGMVFVDQEQSERRVSYRELWDHARSVAGGLLARGLVPGNRVAIAVGDPFAFVSTLLGALVAGMVPVPLPPHTGMRDAAAFALQLLPTLRISRAALVVADARTLPAILSITGVAEVVLPESLVGVPEGDLIVVSPSEPALLQFTSGSTAEPRGIVLSHENVIANMTAIEQALNVGPHDVVVSWLPLFHDMGLVGMVLASIHTCVNAVLLPPLLFVKQPKVWLSRITRHRGTISFAPSSAYSLAARRMRPRDLEDLDLTSWRVAGVGAEPIHVRDLEAFALRLAPVGFDPRAFAPAYGLAEHVVAVTLSPLWRELRIDDVRLESLAIGSRIEAGAHHEPGTARVVACGRALPGHEIRIVDDMGTPLCDRCVGEIQAQGPSRAGSSEAPEDWLSTGDLGYLDQGELFVCGRKKEVIVIAGRKVHPRDLEWAALEVARVRAVVAFGTHAFHGPERVVIVLEAVLGDSSLAAAVAAHVQDRCGVPVHDVRIVGPRVLPRTTSGKLQRVRVRDLYERQSLDNAPSGDSP